MNSEAAWCIVPVMPRMPFYNQREWQIARRQALHDSGYRCQRCGISLVGLEGGACAPQKGIEAFACPAKRTSKLGAVMYRMP